MADPLERPPLPSVRAVLALPELADGRLELIAGRGGLDREVRWAHVVAGSGADGGASLLDGGELVLTTGAGWPRDETSLARIAEALVDADVAAIVLELGVHFSEAPAPLVAACERDGIPLAVLRREVRFVQITQRVHQRILAAQNEALRARAQVHDMLTELGLNRSPVDYVIERLAETVGAPVVLEDSAHRVVAWSGPGHPPEEVLSAWVASDGRGFELPAGWVRVPVEARGSRWGSLTALPGAPHPAGRRTVLELGAFALALGRLADPDGDAWVRFSSKRLVGALLGGRYRHETELAAQLAAGGLPVAGRVTVGVTLRGAGDFGAPPAKERAVLESALRRAIAPEGRALIAVDDGELDAFGGGSQGATGAPNAGDGAGRAGSERPVLLALLSFPDGDARIAPTGDRAIASPLAARLARELDTLAPATTPSGWRAHLGLGVPARRLRGAISSLETVRAVGILPAATRVGRVSVQQAERQPLAYLVRELSGTPEVQEFASDVLAPLVEYDREHHGDLGRVLDAVTAHPANRSLAAQRARLSRSVFYQRIALIEELLGVDLTDGMTVATLTVALLARRER